MKISVIIPTYKPKDYFKTCLESIKGQIFNKQDFELIIILNGCKEPYQNNILSYISNNFKEYNIKFLQTDVPGVSNARNLGLNNAEGDYITFIDDDDYISENYLQNLYEIALKGYIPLSNLISFDDNTNKILPHITNEIFKARKKNIKYGILKVRTWMSVCYCKLIPKSYIKDRYFDIDLKNSEDALYMFLLSDKMKNFMLATEDTIYFRRYRSDSAVTSQSVNYVLKNLIIKIPKYFKIYFSNPFRYNFIFFCTRLLGFLKTIIWLKKHKKSY